MREPHLADADLDAASVPPADAPLPVLLRFGHRYHAYRVAGSLPRVAEVALALHDEWEREHDATQDAVLDAPLPQLRIALFHTVRALDHAGVGTAPDDQVATGPGAPVTEDEAVWLRVLVRSVAAAVADPAGR